MKQEEIVKVISVLAYAGVRLGDVVRGDIATFEIRILSQEKAVETHEQAPAMFAALKKSTKVFDFVKAIRAIMSEDAEGFQKLCAGQVKITNVVRKESVRQAMAG